MIVLRMEAPFKPLSPGNATHRIRHLSLQLAQDFNKFDQKSKTRKAIYDFPEKKDEKLVWKWNLQANLISGRTLDGGCVYYARTFRNESTSEIQSSKAFF